MVASLIMLSTSPIVVIPMDSANLFQNAMASGKHSDKNNNYEEY